MADRVRSLLLVLSATAAALAGICLAGLVAILLMARSPGPARPAPAGPTALATTKDAGVGTSPQPLPAASAGGAGAKPEGQPAACSPPPPGAALPAAPPPPPPPPPGYSLELGRFVDRPDLPGCARARAETLAAAIAALGYAPKAAPINDGDGRGWIAVRLGPYPDRATAEAASESLATRSGVTTDIVYDGAPAGG